MRWGAPGDDLASSAPAEASAAPRPRWRV